MAIMKDKDPRIKPSSSQPVQSPLQALPQKPPKTTVASEDMWAIVEGYSSKKDFPLHHHQHDMYQADKRENRTLLHYITIQLRDKAPEPEARQRLVELASLIASEKPTFLTSPDRSQVIPFLSAADVASCASTD